MSEYYVVEYELWPTYDPDENQLGRHTDKSTYEAADALDAINTAMYYVRGRKSNFEMASIINVHGPYENEGEARRVQYQPDE